jgi:ubiquinone/menaquinone biosynthesis C-methylase UbiE
MASSSAALPPWAGQILVTPCTCLPLSDVDGRLVTAAGEPAARVDGGIVRFPLSDTDTGIAFYRDVGGARFHERAAVPYAMTALDTTVYHSYLAELRPNDPNALIVDVGGGDGRNAIPWLEWGFRRVAVVDPAGAALERLRARIATDHPDWLERLLLIEADARRLPLLTGCAERVQAIEALAYLNEDYSSGLSECIRVMANRARLLVADRDFEGGLLARLFYGGGIAAMLQQSQRRDILDGNDQQTVRSHCFTADEFAALMEQHGLRILSHRGVSALSLIIGHERVAGRLAPEDDAYVGEVRALLRGLGRRGTMRRSHVIIAERPE